MRLTVRPRAELDIDEAFAWYESRREGLGEVFLRSVDACFERLRREPDIYAVQYSRVRRARLHRFPYAVLYVIREDRVDVLSKQAIVGIPKVGGLHHRYEWPDAA